MKKPISKEAKLFRLFIAHLYIVLALGIYRMAVVKGKGYPVHYAFLPFEIKFLTWALYDWEKEEEKLKNKVFTKEDFKP